MVSGTRNHFFILGISLSFFLAGYPGASLLAQNPAGDTVLLSLQDAEKTFLANNLTLIASHYDIDINKAIKLQATYWDNPVINTDQNIYDGKFFRHKYENGNYFGQIYLQLQQLIRTAGKRNRLVRMAEDNIVSSENQFAEELRNLKLILITDINTLQGLQQTEKVYAREMALLQRLVTGMEAMFKEGDISEMENIRMKGLLYALQQDRNENLLEQEDLEKDLRVLLQLPDSNWVITDSLMAIPKTDLQRLAFVMLQDSALLERPDLALARNNQLYQQHNLLYQKAVAVPDITAGIEYDRSNSYVPKYYGVSLSFPIPMFNKNKGNINAADYSIKQAAAKTQETESMVRNEVETAWLKLQKLSDIIDDDDDKNRSDFDRILLNMTESYRQRQVSLIAFIDFFTAWKDNQIRRIQMIRDQRNAAATLNFVTDTDIIKL
ncbi:MAG: hypothetical protein GC171_11775 [Terrimonas sp.]|nr:hypothetical protein [Terrimonas sp.]